MILLSFFLVKFLVIIFFTKMVLGGCCVKYATQVVFVITIIIEALPNLFGVGFVLLCLSLLKAKAQQSKMS